MKKYLLPIVLLALLISPTALAAGNLKINGFSANVTHGPIVLHTRLTGNVAGHPAHWRWTFKNEITGATTYSSSNPSTHHNFGKPGIYDVTLQVWGPNGSDQLTKKAYVTAYTIPAAGFSAAPTTGKVPLVVKFTDKSTKMPTSWKWNFGDGTISIARNPTHKYTRAGKYTVSLTVKNEAGSNTKTVAGDITVRSK
jgi:PKD repeat protein